ncbi:MAG TPA: ankyrin repeat domain-containing protein [Blastocatellia bacterium]|nr:ankyrin repeat domain-containing protein [Blastocatellia bacterium]
MSTKAKHPVSLSGSPHFCGPDPERNLVLAALKGNTGRVIELLDAGSDPDARDGQGRTPLLEAAFGGHSTTVSALIRAGANPNARDADGWTPLMEAASKGRVDIVKKLVAANADVNARNRLGQTALEVVARDHVGLARLIRRCAAEP